MKNYKQRIVCGLFIIIMTLTACQNNPTGNTDSEHGKNTESQNTETQNTEIQNTQVKNEVEDDSLQKSAILKNIEQLDDAGIVKYISNERIESGLQQEIRLFADNLLLWGYCQDPYEPAGFKVSLISLQTGEILEERRFFEMELPNVQVCGDKIAVADWGNGKVYVLDKEFQIVDEYETGTEYCAIYLNTTATEVFCFTQEGVQVHDIKAGYKDLLFEDAMMLYASSLCGDAVTVTYTEKSTQLNAEGVVDLSTGKTMSIPFSGAFQGVEYNDGVWLAGVMGEQGTYYIGKNERPYSLVANEENSMITLLANPGRIMSTSYDAKGTPIMCLYSLDGSFLSQCKLPIDGAAMIYEPIWSAADGGYFFLVIDSTGKDMLLFWDLSAPVSGENLTLESQYDGEKEINGTLSKEIYDRAEKIENEYGVGIVLGDQVDEEYGNYKVDQELEEAYISDALEVLENVLSSYPEGFMEQLLYGNQKVLEFHLVGAFTMKDIPDDANGFTSYVGLAEEQGGKTVVVVDITTPGSLEKTLHHEIMHVIDNKLVFLAGLETNPLYSEEAWNALNPAGFSYTEDKLNLPESIYNDGYESYFIDLYSRTTAKEDRARIMEYAMIEADWAFSASAGRLAKLEYLCQCIRDAFDTEGWIEQTVWEKTLDRCQK